MITSAKGFFLTLLCAGQMQTWAAKVNLDVHQETLPNGLQVLVHTNTQAPTVACRLFYVTGSVHEVPGKSGLAHMLEHMLFKGTRKVGVTDSVLDAKLQASQDSLQTLLRAKQGTTQQMQVWKALHDSLMQQQRTLMIKDELWETYLKAGGTGLNAFTTDLMTAYFVTLPKNKVELFLWLEADRMHNAVLRDFYAERDVVREERRMRVEDNPTGRYNETLEAMFYEAFPYRVPTIGWPSDIENLTREMAEEHYRRYYKPRNAILVLAGDLDTSVILPQVRRYFANIPTGEAFAPITLQEPTQVGEKRLIVRRNDAKPRLDIMFHTAEVGHPDIYALDIVEGVLNGKSGRLNRRLVDKEKLAVSVSASNRPNKYSSSFSISVALRPEADAAKVESILFEELQRLQSEDVSDKELQKVRNTTAATLVRSLTEMEHLATMLAWYQMFGDWRWLMQWPDRINEVTADQVKDVATRTFVRKGATVGLLLPEDSAP